MKIQARFVIQNQILSILLLLFAVNLCAGEWIADPKSGCQVWDAAPVAGESISWSGACLNGKANGAGEVQWYVKGVKKDKYIGDYKDGQCHGQGTYVGADGNKYEGDWLDGKRHGQGTHVWADGSKYEGDWLDDKRHGQGTRVSADGNKYEGDWLDDKRHGQGTYVSADGDKYQGDLADDKINGKGIYTWADGDSYASDWLDGKRHGKGTLTRTNGGTLILCYINGKEVKEYEYDDYIRNQWIDAGFSGDEEHWLKSGLTISEAKKWKDAGFSSKLDGIYETEIENWIHSGLTISEAKKWKDAGFSPDEPKEWINAGFSKDEAVRWANGGTDTELAVTRKKAGLSSEKFIVPEFKTLREESIWKEERKKEADRMSACWYWEEAKLKIQYLVTTDDTKGSIEKKFQKYTHDWLETEEFKQKRNVLIGLAKSIDARSSNNDLFGYGARSFGIEDDGVFNYQEKHFCLDSSKNSIVKKDMDKTIFYPHGLFAITLIDKYHSLYYYEINEDYYKQAYRNFDKFKSEYMKSKTKVNTTQQKLKAKY